MDDKLLGFGVHLASRAGIPWVLETLESRRENILRILVYHRIGDPAAESGWLDPSLLSAMPEQFDLQMHFLRKNYHVLSIVDLLQTLDHGGPLPPRSAMVTFDDGYRDFLDTAWPTLERYQIPAILFLATGFMTAGDELFWWDRLYQGISRTRRKALSLPPTGDFPLETPQERWTAFIALKQRVCAEGHCCAMALVDRILAELEVIPQTAGLLLNWTEARDLHARGCCLAAHTRSHPILSRLSAHDGFQEVCASQEDICREIGTSYPVIAYPSGLPKDCNQDLEPLLCQQGYKIAMSSSPGYNVFPFCNLLRLKRIGVPLWVGLPVFRMILTGTYNLYCDLQVRIHPEC